MPENRVFVAERTVKGVWTILAEVLVNVFRYLEKCCCASETCAWAVCLLRLQAAPRYSLAARVGVIAQETSSLDVPEKLPADILSFVVAIK